MEYLKKKCTIYTIFFLISLEPHYIKYLVKKTFIHEREHYLAE